MTKVKLSKRLQMIADMVDKKSVLADIGCDHALLDIYLIQNNIIKKSIAADITNGALDGARRNLSLYEVDDKKVELRLSDGLEKINKEDKVDTIVISGLGNQKIISIFQNDYEKLENINNIIIQSNTGVNYIRKYMTSIGYYIDDEVLVKENNIIYTIIKFTKGSKKYSKKELFYGPILLNNKDDLFNELLSNLINKNNYIINKLPNSKLFKKLRLKLDNNKIKKQLK